MNLWIFFNLSWGYKGWDYKCELICLRCEWFIYLKYIILLNKVKVMNILYCVRDKGDLMLRKCFLKLYSV